MTDISELIERVKLATGPERDLAMSIAAAVLGGEWKPYTEARRVKIKWLYSPTGMVLCYGPEEPERWLSSIDAALALVERLFGLERPSMLYSYDLNWHASAHAHMSYTADLHIAVGSPPVMRHFHGQAHTQPLAILSALLLSLQSEADK